MPGPPATTTSSSLIHFYKFVVRDKSQREGCLDLYVSRGPFCESHGRMAAESGVVTHGFGLSVSKAYSPGQISVQGGGCLDTTPLLVLATLTSLIRIHQLPPEMAQRVKPLA